jgi:cytochrome c peroxidase
VLLRTPSFCIVALGAVVLGCALIAAHALPRKGETPSAMTALPASVERDIDRVVAEIDRIEAEALAQASSGRPSLAQRTFVLSKLLVFDKQLSVNRNEACAFCHMPESGFTGPISALNATTVAYPGSVRTRFSQRKPQTHSYAPFAPVLHYNASQGDFVGGNFWDMRATGIRLRNPAAEQAQAPPLNPVEMGLPDAACAVFRLSQRPYRSLFEGIWGKQSFAIMWPADVEQVCDTPGPASTDDPLPLHLDGVGRGIAQAAFDDMALSIAAYEASSEASPFSSKFDAVIGKTAKFTPQEQLGYDLFRGKGRCNECHRDGGPGEEPLFTDFTASNLGVPKNRAMPYYAEQRPDQRGYVANPDGSAFIDRGVGGFLGRDRELSGDANPNPAWESLAGTFMGKHQVPTLRNVDKRPYDGFVKAYMHNGYFTSLKDVVHFYNTRDVLPSCAPNDPGEKVSCWPPPEDPENENKRQLGNLGLTDQEEDAVVVFMQTLTDGYLKNPEPAPSGSQSTPDNNRPATAIPDKQ